MIDSEKTFYPPAAAALGIDLKRLILVRPGKKIACPKIERPTKSLLREEAGTETLWALEQTLQSRGVAVTFCRLERINAQVFRRLQLAAERGGGLGFLHPRPCRAEGAFVERRAARGRTGPDRTRPRKFFAVREAMAR